MRGRAISYSAAELAWLKANRCMIISDYHTAFCAAFRRKDVKAGHLHGLRKRNGWKVGRAPGRFKGRHLKFSKIEIAWLRANRTLPISDYHKAFCTKFRRADVTPQRLHALRKREGWKTGRTGQFVKGAVPANKGKACAPDMGGRHPNARKTQFKKGNLPHNTHYLGHERISKDGYVEISVDEINPRTGYERRYVLKHRWLWEKKHGPIPDGMILKCKDSDKTNTDPSNWELVPRAVLARLNGGRHKTKPIYDAAPAELRPTIMAVAKLEHQIREKARNR